MPRRVLIAPVLAAAYMLATAATASAATLRVCPHGCEFSQIGPAIRAASPGDTVKVATGTYHGGVTIEKNLSLQGAGARSTIIRGGGPVITVGKLNAATEPSVTITDLTITGGRNERLDEFARGEGLYVPWSKDLSVGATVLLERTRVIGNVAAPRKTVPTGPPCPHGPCPFAGAEGAGIFSAGSLTVRDSVVADNVAAGLASDADGAGIFVAQQGGALTVIRTLVTENRAVATIPNGRFAEGGGIFVGQNAGAVTVLHSVIAGNSVSLTSALPVHVNDSRIDMNANSGGIHISDGLPSATVEDTRIAGNSVIASDPDGEPLAFDAGMLVGDTPLTMRDTSVTGNRTSATYATSIDLGPSGTAVEVDGGGTITHTLIARNVNVARSPHGPAAESGGLAVYNFTGDPRRVTVQDSEIIGNGGSATSDTGSATVLGGGVFNNSLLTLQHVVVRDNFGEASGSSGVAQGGGIWNGVDLSGPPVELTLRSTTVTGNSLTASPGLEIRGGGLFSTSPVTFIDSVIQGNRPDDCAGVAC